MSRGKPTFKEALKFWIKLGFISFGGPAGQIAIMYDFLVIRKKWISESKFLHALNYCMLLPGPEAQQLATYTGWLLHGTRGGLAAGILFVFPSMCMLLLLSIGYVAFGNNPWIYSMLIGLKPAVIAIVGVACIKIGKKALLSSFHYVVAFAAFIGLFFFNIPFPLIITGAFLVSVLIRYFFPVFFDRVNTATTMKTIDENAYVINKNTVADRTGFNPRRFWGQFLLYGCLWAIPFAGFYFLTGEFEFWEKLGVFFTKAALVTFGGAYAVLPYVAQVSVEKFNWLSDIQMIDGLALGETTPGPLIMILAFVGFMAGYNHFGNSLSMGTLGLVTSTFYTFLPSFFFIFAGAPVIERTQNNKKLKEILSLVSAAVVGVVFNLAIYLSKTVFFPRSISISDIDYPSVIWTVVSFFALHRYKVNIMLWIGISAISGLAYYFFTSYLPNL